VRFGFGTAFPAFTATRNRTRVDSPRIAAQCTLHCALLAAVLFGARSAQASSIQYERMDLGAGRYRYVYTVTNDGTLGAAIQGFDIFFAPALYLESSLAITTSPAVRADWDELILGSGVLIPAAYDVLALSGGVGGGATQTGFAVEFDWTGSGLPGAQAFEIFDPQTFQVLESGLTTPIPEPGSLVLLALGVAALAMRRSPTPIRHSLRSR